MDPYQEIIDEYLSFVTRDSNRCISLGINRKLDQLPDPSLSFIDETLLLGDSLLSKIKNIDQASLTFHQQLDLDLASLAIRYELNLNSRVTTSGLEIRQKPTAGDRISYGIFMMFIDDPRPVNDRLLDISSRINQVPEFLKQCIIKLKRPVKRWCDVEKQKMRSLPELFKQIYEWAEKEAFPLKNLKSAIKIAESAITDYLKQLDEMLKTDDFHVGYSEAKNIIKLRGIDLSIEELSTLSKEFLKSTGDSIEGLRRDLCSKYKLPVTTTATELHSFLNRSFKLDNEEGDPNLILAKYQQERDKILEFIEQRELFPILDGQEFKIMKTPAFMEPSIPAGAMVSPPPFREGIRRSIIYLTLKENHLDKHTQLEIPVLMIHEGIPGHHLQLSYASKHKSTVRRTFSAMDQTEGWTTMLEDYMLDQGYMKDLTPECRFITKREICRLGARVAIDLYFMTGDSSFLSVGIEVDLSRGDPFEKAGKLLKAVTGFSNGRVEAELNWYSMDRGYPLSYLAGNALIWKLKSDLVTCQKGRCEGRDLDQLFHKAYMKAGSMPLSFLRKLFEHDGLID